MTPYRTAPAERTSRALRAENAAMRAEIVALRRRVAELEGKPHPTLEGRNADGSMRCPCADIPGEVACDEHSYSGCGWHSPATPPPPSATLGR